MNISLKQMRYTLAVAEENHFGRAAARCNVTQPALSQQIKLVEELSGTPIFDRTGKTIRLTPFGQAFVERATPIVREADALLAFATGHKGHPVHALRFGIIPTIAPYLLPEIYPALTNALPDTRFVISENRTEKLLAELELGDLDIALIATDLPKGSRLAQKPLFADPFVLATAKDHAQGTGPVSLNDIPPDQILLLDEGHCLRDQAIEACALRGPGATRAFAATSLSTIVEFVANGQGVTLLPAISLSKEAATPRIQILPLERPGAGRQLSLVWHSSTPFTPLFSKIAAVIVEAGEPLTSSLLP